MPRAPDPARRLAPGLLAACLLVACGAPRAARDAALRGTTMGTTWSVRLARAVGASERAELTAGIARVLADVDGRMSTWKPTSEVSRFNASASTDWFPLSLATAEVLAEAQTVGEASGGAFDVTVGPLVDAWGFGSRPRTALPDAGEIDRVRDRVGWRLLAVRRDPPAARKARPDVEVDLSAIAKGYAIDRVVDYLAGAGVRAALVELGGEVAARGRRADGTPWRVGVERPLDAERPGVQRTVSLEDAALATSGDYRRFVVREGRRLSHVLDPRTGRPVRHGLTSATVIAPTAMRADAWATALMVLGPDEALAAARREGLAVLLLSQEEDGIVEASTPGFAARVAGAGRAEEPGGAGGGPWPLVAGAFLVFLLSGGALALRRATRVKGCLADCDRRTAACQEGGSHVPRSHGP